MHDHTVAQYMIVTTLTQLLIVVVLVHLVQ